MFRCATRVKSLKSLGRVSAANVFGLIPSKPFTSSVFCSVNFLFIFQI